MSKTPAKVTECVRTLHFIVHAKTIFKLISELGLELLKELGLDTHANAVMKATRSKHIVGCDFCGNVQLNAVRLTIEQRHHLWILQHLSFFVRRYWFMSSLEALLLVDIEAGFESGLAVMLKHGVLLLIENVRMKDIWAL
jgi:uncharacterized membrane protein (DUF2068 family)